MFIVIKNNIPSLQQYKVGDVIENFNNQYVIKCTNTLIEVPMLELTKKYFKLENHLDFKFNDRKYNLALGTILDLAYIQYLGLDEKLFIELKIVSTKTVETDLVKDDLETKTVETDLVKDDLETKTVEELKLICDELKIEYHHKNKEAVLIEKIRLHNG
jgi:hypothetical protein